MEQNPGTGNGLCCEINAKIFNRQQHNGREIVSKALGSNCWKMCAIATAGCLTVLLIVINCLLLGGPLVLSLDMAVPYEYT